MSQVVLPICPEWTLAHPTRFERVTFAFGELRTSELQSVFNVRTFQQHGNKAGNLARYADKVRTLGEGLCSAAQEVGMMVAVHAL
jgi:hypothetical protein